MSRKFKNIFEDINVLMEQEPIEAPNPDELPDQDEEGMPTLEFDPEQEMDQENIDQENMNQDDEDQDLQNNIGAQDELFQTDDQDNMDGSVEDYPKPDYVVRDAVNTIKGLLSNWMELRLNFPPEDKEKRIKIVEMGDVLNGIKLELEKLM